MKPIVAVVGRPNVGKSTIFNMLCGERISIVKDTPGVTRDRIYGDSDWGGHAFTLIDTGGIDPDSDDVLLSSIREQAQIAIETADVIMFVTDIRTGVMDADEKVANILRRSQKPIVLAVNKVDNFDKWMADTYEFYQLGLGDPIPISATGKLGIGELLDAIITHFPAYEQQEEEDDTPRIAVVGKPNVGKSSLINRLTGDNRAIVSDIAGTTRDAIDSRVRYHNKDYIFVDTAGLRRKSKIKEELERFSIIRAISAIEKSDVVILMIDAAEGVTEQDAKIAGIAHDRGRGMIIAVNKWDLIEKDNHSVKQYTEKIRSVLSFMPYASIQFISVASGQRVNNLYQTIDAVLENHAMRIQTGVLNEIVAEATALVQPPMDKGKRLRIYYATQVSVKPPTFVFFVNKKELMHFSYLRYLENQIREAFGFSGTPLRFLLRLRKDES